MSDWLNLPLERASKLLKFAADRLVIKYWENENVDFILGMRDCAATFDAALAEPPTPSPTGTEIALAEAKRHIDILCRFAMDNERWVQVSNEAFAFISGLPKEDEA